MNKWIILLLSASVFLGAYRTSPHQPLIITGQAVPAAVALNSSAPEPPVKPSDKPSVKASDKPASILDDTVNRWKLALAKEHGFESWEKATWSSYTLGPGNHGWAVILVNEGKEIGYMIIHAAENGELRLTEYGTGSSPLFSLTTLYRSLIQLGLIPESTKADRLYLGPLQGVWTLTADQKTYVLDAKTGETLPFDNLSVMDNVTIPLPSNTTFSGKLEEKLLPSFDPYERLPWVQGNPVAISGLDELRITLQNNPKLTYVSEPYAGKVTYALAVLGYRKWEKDDPYLILDHEGPCYLPLLSALSRGKLYP
ncbi:hypothetical protein [Paenibacillus sp. GP183]|uniref:hypothetical protein n=1 Tax=Paenibacillus sp. GP183 TaxID=1882751 RepID=UPI00089C3A6B|nr:hypothetical protein [Paenibacillus sp. GP183]SEB74344.1 hypothetical protein SAMN05443246_1768 [Paenibacillus sp. GP183]